MASRSATHMQRFDEAGLPIGPVVPLDPSMLDRAVGPSGEAEFPFLDGVYRSLGHIGNFVLGIQRVRTVAGFSTVYVEDPLSAMKTLPPWRDVPVQ